MLGRDKPRGMPHHEVPSRSAVTLQWPRPQLKLKPQHSYMNTTIPFRFWLLLMCAAAVTFPTDFAMAQNVERWIHPAFGHNGSPCSGCGIDTYANDYEQNYPSALRETDVFQFFINDID